MTWQQLYKQSIYHQLALITLLIRRWYSWDFSARCGSHFRPIYSQNFGLTGTHRSSVRSVSIVVGWWNGLSAFFICDCVNKWPNVDPDSTKGRHFTEVGKAVESSLYNRSNLDWCTKILIICQTSRSWSRSGPALLWWWWWYWSSSYFCTWAASKGQTISWLGYYKYPSLLPTQHSLLCSFCRSDFEFHKHFFFL